MRKQDIIITTAKKSTIYAYGTATPSNQKVFSDLNDWGSKNYAVFKAAGDWIDKITNAISAVTKAVSEEE